GRDVDRLVRRCTFQNDDGFLLALQCQARGHYPLARALFHAALKSDREETPKTKLANIAWLHRYLDLTERDSDRRAIARYMKILLARENSLDTEQNRELLQSLELTLQPSKSKPGSVESLIDGFVNVHSPTASFGFRSPDTAYLAVVELG